MLLLALLVLPSLRSAGGKRQALMRLWRFLLNLLAGSALQLGAGYLTISTRPDAADLLVTAAASRSLSFWLRVLGLPPYFAGSWCLVRLGSLD